MSNGNTTFRLQAFGTSSAFDPYIIDKSRYSRNSDGESSDGGVLLNNKAFF